MPKADPRRFKAPIEPHIDGLFRSAYGLTRNRADAQDLAGGRLKVTASIEDPVLIGRIVAHVQPPAADDDRIAASPRACRRSGRCSEKQYCDLPLPRGHRCGHPHYGYPIEVRDDALEACYRRRE